VCDEAGTALALEKLPRAHHLELLTVSVEYEEFIRTVTVIRILGICWRKLVWTGRPKVSTLRLGFSVERSAGNVNCIDVVGPAGGKVERSALK